ncbi:PQQ-binding-like beta-propeller repeat protein [Planctomycetota bacterium]
MLNHKWLCLAALGLVFMSAFASAADWPQYRGPAGDGISTEEILVNPWEVWTASVGTGYAGIVIADGLVYTAGHDEAGGIDTIHCFKADTGAPVWKYSYRALSVKGTFPAAPGDLEITGPRATPVVEGGDVYALSIDGHLFCLDAYTGEVIWYKNVVSHYGGVSKANGFRSSPVVEGTNLLLDIGGSLAVINKANGVLVRTCPGGGGFMCAVTPLVVSPSLVIFGSRNMIGVDPGDGQVQWQYDMGREAMAPHLFSSDYVVFSTYPESGILSRLDTSGGTATMDWENTLARTYQMTNVLAGGYLFTMDNTGTASAGNDDSVSTLRCLDFADGTENWTSPAIGWSNIIAADNALVILRETGELITADISASYTPAGPYAVIDSYCWTPPALADGRLYCRNDEGDLVCLSVAPAVTIEATDPMAFETSDNGAFTISRLCEDVSSPLPVNILLGGDEEGTDYALTGGVTTVVTIPGGSAFVVVDVMPGDDDGGGDSDNESVTMTLQPGAGYTVGPRDSAAVYIVDSGASFPTVDIAAVNGWTLEGGFDTDYFIVSRDAVADYPLAVPVSMSGAVQGTDYELQGSDGTAVIIPAGQPVAFVTVKAWDNALTDGSRDVTMTFGASIYYTDGTPDFATITIIDDETPGADADLDGMDDDWELCYWGNTAEDGTDDYDLDGLTDADEYAWGTDPDEGDTDKDGITDGDEVSNGTHPVDPTSFIPVVLVDEKEAWCAPGRGPQNAGGLLLMAVSAVLAWAGLRLLCRRS